MTNLNLFRSELGKLKNEKCLVDDEIVKLEYSVSNLNDENKKLNSDLDLTRIERDDTVSEMRQEIERLNLLQGDEKQLKEKQEHFNQKAEDFKVSISKLETENNYLLAKNESLNIEREDRVAKFKIYQNLIKFKNGKLHILAIRRYFVCI